MAKKSKKKMARDVLDMEEEKETYECAIDRNSGAMAMMDEDEEEDLQQRLKSLESGNFTLEKRMQPQARMAEDTPSIFMPTAPPSSGPPPMIPTPAPARGPAPPGSAPKKANLETLVLNFSFDGKFTDLSLLQGFLDSASQALLSTLLSSHPDQKEMILTTVAFMILQEKFSKQKAEWEMLAKKSKQWLKTVKNEAIEVQLKTLILV